MDPTWTAPMWFVLMTLGLGIGAGFATWFGLTIYLPRSQERAFSDWIVDGRALAIRVIDTDAAAAGAKRDLFEWIGKLPADFNPTMFLAVDLGMGLHRAVLNEAERRGIVQRGCFERVYGMAVDAADPVTLLDTPIVGLGSVPPPSGSHTMHATAMPAMRSALPTDVHDIGAWLQSA